jgi:hypothetical protein
VFDRSLNEVRHMHGRLITVSAAMFVTLGCAAVGPSPTPQQEAGLQALREMVDATRKAFGTEPIRVLVGSEPAGYGSTYQPGLLTVAPEFLTSRYRDARTAEMLGYALLPAFRTDVVGATNPTEYESRRADRALRARVKGVEILERVRGMREEEALRAMAAWLVEEHERIASGKTIPIYGHLSACAELNDLLDRFPQSSGLTTPWRCVTREGQLQPQMSSSDILTAAPGGPSVARPAPAVPAAPPSPAAPMVSAASTGLTPHPPVAPLWAPGDEWAFQEDSPQGQEHLLHRVQVIDGVEAYVIASGTSRELFLRKSDLAYMMETVSGQIDTRLVPAESRFVWPLAAHVSWQQEVTTERPLERQSSTVTRACETGDSEVVTVPAGTFTAVKVTCRNRGSGEMLTEQWYAPAAKFWVKERRWFSYGIRTRELTSVRLH